ncbi:MAG: Crp/Fnr family transcriptional regulator [Methanomassiliicoccaceae archaeon]|nr:Crp/Fnr family transcriptional regulator [Methanomassiliicoccaceae archaeon]
MKKIFENVKENPLFSDIAFSDFERMIKCLNAETRTYRKNEVILRSGDTVNFVGLVLSGGVNIKKEDNDGRIVILTDLGISEAFGEVFACAGISQSPVTIQAAEDSEILFFNYRKIITTCTSACPFHAKLIENMMRLVAQKNIELAQKIDILSKRTTRDKLLCFFDMHRGAAKRFTIPFDREELAQYLCVDRSAMSNELCKMRSEGIIKFQRNTFELLKI